MAEEIDISAVANAPKSGTNPDGQQFVMNDVDKIVEAKKFVDGNVAAALPARGIRFSRFTPPGPRD